MGNLHQEKPHLEEPCHEEPYQKEPHQENPLMRSPIRKNPHYAAVDWLCVGLWVFSVETCVVVKEQFPGL